MLISPSYMIIVCQVFSRQVLHKIWPTFYWHDISEYKTLLSPPQIIAVLSPTSSISPCSMLNGQCSMLQYPCSHVPIAKTVYTCKMLPLKCSCALFIFYLFQCPSSNVHVPYPCPMSWLNGTVTVLYVNCPFSYAMVSSHGCFHVRFPQPCRHAPLLVIN